MSGLYKMIVIPSKRKRADIRLWRGYFINICYFFAEST